MANHWSHAAGGDTLDKIPEKLTGHAARPRR